MAIPTNDRLPDDIENVLKEYEELLGDEYPLSEPDINIYVSEVISEIQQMRENDPFSNK